MASTFTRAVVCATAAALLLAGCSSSPQQEPPTAGSRPATSSPTTPDRQEPAAELDSNLTGQPVHPGGTPVRVTVTGGTLVEVTARTADGSVLDGRLTLRGWRSMTTPLPNSRYTVTAQAQNRTGRATQETWTFHTPPARRTDFPAVTPLAGATVGVGHPVVVYLDHDVVFKKAFEDRLSVTTSKPVIGSWGWIDDRTVAYRPRRFWPAHTAVTVTLDVGKTQTAPGRWVLKDRTIAFRTGRAQVLRIRDASHTLTVHRAGRAIRRIPVSLGKPGFTTRSGVKVVMTREQSRFMDSDTVGIGGSEAYALEVPYALRITATGEFIHGAPWSEWAQGSRNVSHGCTNISLANAIWLYKHTLIGDPVITVGTGRGTEEWNGLGGIWNFDWEQWRTRSAHA